ncbi:MAG: YkgJ family cysteine cluster protein [Bacteroides sp.]
MLNQIHEFSCKKCGECCKGLQPESIVLFPKDIVNISDGLEMSPKEFMNRYCVICQMTIEEQKVEVCYLKTIYEDCPFLINNLCSIQEFKPTQCELTPYNFFSYYRIWSYLECISEDAYPEGKSKENDILLIEELLDKGYVFD